MSELGSPEFLWPIVLILLAAIAAIVLWLRSRRKTPQEKERLRRLDVNARGRLADGELLDGTEAPPTGNLIYYKYRASGVEYSAAQDISAISGIVQLAHCRPGDTASVKYDPRAPSNSIIVCEKWSGLQGLRDGSTRPSGNSQARGDVSV